MGYLKYSTASILLCVLVNLMFIEPSNSDSIEVYSPPSLHSKFKNIPFTSATFGSIPYSHSIMGRVQKLHPLDGCQPFNTRIDHSNSSVIGWVNRGNCPFDVKAVNAQKLGVSALIIEDFQNDAEYQVPTTANETLEDIKIPILMVNEVFLKEIDDTLNHVQNSEFIASISFDIVS